MSRPGLLLRLEGATVLAVALLLYSRSGSSWLLFALLALAPDLSMLGYLGGAALGARAYNLFHIYPLPAALAVYGLLTGAPLALAIALIWFAHIGADRMLGFGLKYPTAFQDNHLSRV
jgi:hypothetical protein